MQIIAIDTETSYNVFSPWMPGWYLSVVGIVSSDGYRKTFWFYHNDIVPTVQAVPQIQKEIDKADVCVAHNWKFDMNVLRAIGVNFDHTNFWCTMVAEYLLNGQDKDIAYGLSPTSERHGFPPKLDKVKLEWDRGKDTCEIDAPLLEEYVLDDAQLALNIYLKQHKLAQEFEMVRLIELQSEYIKVLSDIETNGFLFDAVVARNIVKDTEQKIEELEAEFREICNEPYLNLSSPQQKSAVLFGGKLKVGIPKWVTIPRKTLPETVYKEIIETHEYTHPGIGFSPPKGLSLGKFGYYSTDKNVVNLLNPGRNKVLRRAKEILFEHSHYNKLKNTLEGQDGNGLLNKICEDGLIHPTLNNAVTATGRLSSSDPNSQNLPRGNTSPIKTCIKARFDGIYQIDLSQIEWRGAAELSQDEVMINEVNSGIDQHIQAVVDPDLMGLKFIDKSDPESKKNRDNAKVFNFRMIYGGSGYGFYRDEKMPDFSLRKWNKICAGFERKYRGLAEYNARNIGYVLSHGFLTIPTGRRFKFKKTLFKDGIYTYNDRQVKNYPVQGLSGGDMLPLLAVVIRRGLVAGKFKSIIILTVHDSLVFDYKDGELERLNKLCLAAAKALPQYYEAYFGHKWVTKLDAESEIGPNYGTLKGYDETK